MNVHCMYAHSNTHLCPCVCVCVCVCMCVRVCVCARVTHMYMIYINQCTKLTSTFTITHALVCVHTCVFDFGVYAFLLLCMRKCVITLVLSQSTLDC
jgi:hypothetical protein